MHWSEQSCTIMPAFPTLVGVVQVSKCPLLFLLQSFKPKAAPLLNLDAPLLSPYEKWVSWHPTTASCGCPAGLSVLNVGVLAFCL